MISVKEYFNCVKTTMYQSVFTRRMSYILSLLVMLTCFVSNAEGSFSSEVFRLVAEGNCRFMCILKYLLLLLPLKLRYLWQLNSLRVGLWPVFAGDLSYVGARSKPSLRRLVMKVGFREQVFQFPLKNGGILA